MNTCFFPYIGGKFNLLKKLISLIPEHKTYVEVFGGAGTLLLNKPKSKVEVFNDVDSDLINLFMVVREKPEEFLRKFRFLLYSRELNKRWSRAIDSDDLVERAARFYYVIRSSFSGSWGAGWSFKKNKPKRFFDSLETIDSIAKRLKSVHIENLDFRKCINIWDSPNTFFFLDPPYYGKYRYRKNLTIQDHSDLKEILGKVKGKWLLTYNDHPKVREVYDMFTIQRALLPLTASLAKSGNKRKAFANLIITNYSVEKRNESKMERNGAKYKL
jgi:DNA adenine methylase